MNNFICKKCGSTEYEIKDKANGTGIAHGLYCAKCGFWHKWLGKEELKQYKQEERKETNENKAEKSLRWVVNQIPDFEPKNNEEKMLLAIKLYSEAGAEEIKRLESENAAMRERLDKAVELPVKVGDIVYCVEDEDEDGDYIVEPTVVTKKNIYLLCSRIKGNPSDAFLLQKAAEEWCKELKGEKK